MIHDSSSRARRASRHPLLEALEGRSLPTPPTLYGAFPRPEVPRAASQVAVSDLNERGLAKFAFTGLFRGSFTTGPALFRDQSAQTFIRGGGTTSRTLHANTQIALYTPADPGGVTTGLVGIFDKNVANTGNQVFLSLTGDPASVDRAGRPTRFTWTAGDGAGGFGGATGEGTMEVSYAPSRRVPRGATSAGTASVIIRGVIVTDNGVSNLLTLGS